MARFSKCRRTTTISDLPNHLQEDILFRLPMKSLRPIRATCRNWNSLTTNQNFANVLAGRRQFLGLMLMNPRVCYLRFNLQRNGRDLTDLSLHQVSTPASISISQAYYCNGLLLCVDEDNLELFVWNPFLGQTRWIRSLKKIKIKPDTFAISYDKDGNIKVLMFWVDFTTNSGQICQLYDLNNNNSWKVLDDDASPEWDIAATKLGSVSLNGNTYFFLQAYRDDEEAVIDPEFEHSLFCFDFTEEKFGPRLSLPFDYCLEEEAINLSCVGKEKLALLYNRFSTTKTLEIWVATRIDFEAAKWSKLLKVDVTPLNSIPAKFFATSFFIDEEKRAALIFGYNGSYMTVCYNASKVVGEEGNIKSVNVDAVERKYCHPLESTS